FDITQALKAGAPQELIVEVIDNTADTQPRGKQISNPHGIFYTPCTGIWQTVWLEPVEKIAHVESLRIEPDVDSASVHISVDSVGDDLSLGEIAVLDGDKIIASSAGATKLGLTIKIPQPKLWSPEQPFLYGLRIGLLC